MLGFGRFLSSQEDEFRRKLGGLVVVASNAGGAWTPMGCSTAFRVLPGAKPGVFSLRPFLTFVFFDSSRTEIFSSQMRRI